MRKLFVDVNPFILIFAIALVLSSADRTCAARENGSNSGATLYFFTNEGCRPCKQVEPVLSSFAQRGFPITKVDTSAYPQWVSQFRITSTPTLVLVQGNREIRRHSGLIDSSTLQNWFQSIGVTAATNPPARPAPQPVIPQSQQDAFVRKLDARRNADTLDGDNSTLHQGTRIPGNQIEQLAMDATVRIRVEDPEGISYATGTVIHCHDGEWLVMTCGHVFRDSGGRGKISVEYDFANDAPKKAPGRLMGYDADSRDVGLIAVTAGVNVDPVPLANRRESIQRGQTVFSIGCDHGEPPTIRRTKIKRKAAYDTDRITKYDIYGRPVDGRSGGGLFTNDGKLIGVCNAAAVDFDEGIYTALDTIYWQIAKENLNHLFEPGNRSALAAVTGQPSPKPGVTFGNRPTTPPANQFGVANSQSNEDPRMTPFRREPADRAPVERYANNSPLRDSLTNVNYNRDSPNLRSGTQSNDMEVILIVRSKADPTRTEAITLADPSPQLLKYLEKVGNRQSGESRIDIAQLRQHLGQNAGKTRN